MIAASFTSYLATWADELSSRANRVRQLIGDAHWSSDGGHNEAIIREFLVRHLSTRFRVSRGFIRPPDPLHCCSPEIDVLLTDSLSYPPLFNEASLIIASPLSVVGMLEVKSAFTSSSLRDALANQIAAKHVHGRFVDASRAWNGIVFGTCPKSRTAESLCDTIEEVALDFDRILGRMPNSVTDRPPCLTVDLLPKCVATLDQFVVFFDSDRAQSRRVRMRCFTAGSLSAACALCDLFTFLSSLHHPSSTAYLRDVIENSVQSTPLIRQLNLPR